MSTYQPVYQRLSKLAILRKSNISEQIHQSNILIPDLRNIVIDYAIDDDILRSYRLFIFLENIIGKYLKELKHKLQEYNMITKISEYNIYKSNLMMQTEIHIQ